MASIYRRGKKLWCRLKDGTKHGTSKPTPFYVGEETKATAYARAAQLAINKRRATDPDWPGYPTAPMSGAMRLDAYALSFFKKCAERGVVTAKADLGRYHSLVAPHIGHMAIEEVRPMHVRDMVRSLLKQNGAKERGNDKNRSSGLLAPRTIHHGYNLAHRLFGEAVDDELIAASPCATPPKDLPPIADKNPEWRARSMFATSEIERLISDEMIPPERRVQYALKAIAGLRHGEVAALRWRDYDATMEPLGRLLIARSFRAAKSGRKGTKTGVVAKVPVHRTLASILAAWKISHWERIYGRPPTDDDYVVPSRNFSPVRNANACRDLERDLRMLELRVEACEGRKRTGHRMRAWLITTALADGAFASVFRAITHARPGAAFDLYNEQPWLALCTEMAKLRVSVLGGEVLALATDFATREIEARKRWRNEARAMGRTSDGTTAEGRLGPVNDGDHAAAASPGGPDHARAVARLATALTVAVLAGDQVTARRLALALDRLQPAAHPECDRSSGHRP